MVLPERILAPRECCTEWNGDVATGDAGTLGPDYLAAITARINAYRWMAGLPGGVTLDPTENAEDQQDALMTAANQQLSHDPPSTWIDYTAAGADAASQSNLALGASGTSAIDLYMMDPGDNNTIVGHRRWILDPPTQTMSVGDIPGESDSLWVVQPQATPVPDVSTIAWPPAGFVPDSLIPDRWSLQAPYGSDFTNATVAVTENGIPQQIDILSNSGLDYGGQAIVWDMPDATPPQPGQQVVYNVQIDNAVINGQSQSFSYTTTAFDPTTTTDLTPMPAQIGFLQSGAAVNWTDGTIAIDVARSMNSDQQVSVDYATADGTALAGTNYTATSGVLNFAPGQFYEQIVVPILLGSSTSPGGTFSITLSSPTNATVGPINQAQVTISTTPPPIEFNAPQLEPNDDSGTPGDGITDDSTPAFFGSVDGSETVSLVNGTQVIGTTTSDANGNYVVSVENALAPGDYTLSVFATDATGSTAASFPLYLTIVAPPVTPSDPTLLPADDSGTPGDGITDDADPSLTGTAFAGATVQLLDSQDNVIAMTMADGSGNYVIAIPGSPLAPQTYEYSVDTIDQYGDVSNPSAAFSLTIVAPPPAPSAPALLPGGDSGNPGDGITDITNPSLTGTAFAGATVQLLDANDKVIGTATASGSGVYVIPLAGPLRTGTYEYSTQTVNQYGDVSSPSPACSLTIVAPPATPSAPTLFAGDSNGSPGGETTYSTSPHLVGTTLPDATVQLTNQSGEILATTHANRSGAYVVQVPGPLAIGSRTYRIQIVNQYGDMSSPSPAGTITVVGRPAPVVTVTSAQDLLNKKHQVSEVVVIFSGAVNTAEADRTSTYHLATPGKGGSYTAKNAGVINLKSASYNPAINIVTLTPARPFALSKPVELVVYASGPNGLRDTLGRYINGGKDVVVFPTPGRVIHIAQSAGTDTRTVLTPAAIDALLERDDLAGLRHNLIVRRDDDSVGI